ncbi:hypothetical protein FRX31_008151, partial [Thalictrum thalictroides]
LHRQHQPSLRTLQRKDNMENQEMYRPQKSFIEKQQENQDLLIKCSSQVDFGEAQYFSIGHRPRKWYHKFGIKAKAMELKESICFSAAN